ncbi:hypothetical protein [Mariprofundus ferrooxydans]|uniref:hypothetical protein n=1 Tax=Mariprofundus ferrooxydans TaxID=314344 RepID=UPI000379D5E6|nr:hypothetical protein [Mariprofundus ferrooxydans]
MDFPNVQIAVDLATSISVIVAVGSLLSEGKKNRLARKQQFIMEKTSELIEFIGKKSIEASGVINKYKYLFSISDGTILGLIKKDDVLIDIPEEMSVSGFVRELEDQIFQPLNQKLKFYPYRIFLTDEVQNEIQLLSNKINEYLWEELNSSILSEVIGLEQIQCFPFFLKEKGVLKEAVEPSLLGDDEYIDLIMVEFNKLEYDVQQNLKFSFLKRYKLSVRQHKNELEDIPHFIGRSAQALVKSINDF